MLDTVRRNDSRQFRKMQNDLAALARTSSATGNSGLEGTARAFCIFLNSDFGVNFLRFVLRLSLRIPKANRIKFTPKSVSGLPDSTGGVCRWTGFYRYCFLQSGFFLLLPVFFLFPERKKRGDAPIGASYTGSY